MTSFWASRLQSVKRFLEGLLLKEPVTEDAARGLIFGYLSILLIWIVLVWAGFRFLPGLIPPLAGILVGVSVLIKGAGDLAFERNRSLAARLRVMASFALGLALVLLLLYTGYFLL
jgi:uncharacterized membrane protein (DUF485 family)